MTPSRLTAALGSLTILAALAIPAHAQVSARMFTDPDVSADRIAFVYGGDVWVVPKDGGLAQRLSSPRGQERFARFSPDGSRIAFSGLYDGNYDVYVVPATGGQPTRVTYHPGVDRLIDWTPDGASLLFASGRASPSGRFNQLYRVSADGGLPERLPMEIAEVGALTSDGSTIAFTMLNREFRTWKRYRGGMAPDIWTFDLTSHASQRVTDDPANDETPMWHGDTMYFVSDRGANQRFNIWARDASGSVRQVTDFAEFDVTFPAIGPSDIVFLAGGGLHLLDLATETTREVRVEVVTDLASLKPRTENVSGFLMGDQVNDGGTPETPPGISPTGRRAVFEARGDIFTVPAEHGPIRNLTRSSGVADRNPRWSPDGQLIAWWSDASGEYELTVQAADGSGEPRKITSLGPGFRYAPVWSPDSRKVAFIDEDNRIRMVEIESGRVSDVARSEIWMSHGAIVDFHMSWSGDSRWLAFAIPDDINNSAIHLHDSESGRTHVVTSGYYDDRSPVFDPDGEYLYLLTSRSFAPSYSAVDGTWIYANATQIAAIPLRDDVLSPLPPRSDEEVTSGEGSAGGSDETEPDRSGEAGDSASSRVEIDLDDFERRLVVLPFAPGNYSDLSAVSGKVVVRRSLRTGAGPGDTPVVMYDLGTRKEQTVLADADEFKLSADGKKLLVRSGTRFGIVSLAPDQSISSPLRTAELMAPVDPRTEWRQLVTDAWRMQRDYFYDERIHGVDWNAIREQYLPLVDQAITRWDVNFIIGEMIGELNASHSYRGGGDTESAPSRPVGLLGIDWALENGAYRIAHIVRGAAWDNEVRSPLDLPGVDIDEGDYVLAVNGVPMDTRLDPAAAFEGLAGQTVTVTVSADPQGADSRDVLVTTIASESRLRNLEWIENNRRMVEERSGGRVGYVYVPDTGTNGQTELVRQFNGQFGHEALLIDERFNSGGQIPDRFVELLNRPALTWATGRHGPGIPFPPVSHQGPKAMLMNGWSGSGGDLFPDLFRKAGVGPLIGTRTWGGLIGISSNPSLIDGGQLTVPTFRFYENDGRWFAEGYGVDPDIEVLEDPTALAAGRDTQIERGVDELLRMLAENPVVAPAPRPAPEDRSRPGNRATSTGGGRGGSGNR